jgi:aminoglycoside 3-N-acetyltransferase
MTAPVLDRAAVLNALRALLPDAPRLLIMHSSLSACGRITGGAATVIDAVQVWNAGGTTTMPTHAYCYPRADGDVPVFDRRSTRSVVGAITEAFRQMPGVQRSNHPTHALSAIGPATASLIEGHEACDTPCGPHTPYEKLIAADAAVLMFGVSLDAYTFFHTAEDAAAVPYLYEPLPVQLRYLDDAGKEHGLAMRRHDMHVTRSFSEKDTWLESRGLLRRQRLGRGELLLIPHARQAHEAIVTELRRDPWFLTTRAKH